jgi:hypothetical protein
MSKNKARPECLEAVLKALEANFSSATPRQERMLAGMVRETPNDEISF